MASLLIVTLYSGGTISESSGPIFSGTEDVCKILARQDYISSRVAPTRWQRQHPSYHLPESSIWCTRILEYIRWQSQQSVYTSWRWSQYVTRFRGLRRVCKHTESSRAKNWDGKIMEVDRTAVLSNLVESGDEIEVDKY